MLVVGPLSPKRVSISIGGMDTKSSGVRRAFKHSMRLKIWPRSTAICRANKCSLKSASTSKTRRKSLTSSDIHCALLSTGKNVLQTSSLKGSFAAGRYVHPNGYERQLSGCLKGNARPLSMPAIKVLGEPAADELGHGGSFVCSVGILRVAAAGLAAKAIRR